MMGGSKYLQKPLSHELHVEHNMAHARGVVARLHTKHGEAMSVSGKFSHNTPQAFIAVNKPISMHLGSRIFMTLAFLHMHLQHRGAKMHACTALTTTEG